ncbi:hypothetical protein F4604DRAFT_1492319, partial [Suillus subluteus]
YCQPMLLLFKPWRCPIDLRQKGQGWEDAFQSFSNSCEPWFHFMMKNMQLHHECRTSQDD